MSNRIYFKDQTAQRNLIEKLRQKLTWYAVRGGTELYRTLAPKSANKRVRRLLLKPHRATVVNAPNDITTRSLSTPYGGLMTYAIGEGPGVLFTHGWSGSSEPFYPLMQAVAAKGYKAVSFDHFGHHRSDGKEAHLPLFIRAINIVIEEFNLRDNLSLSVSHSMGSVATLNALKDYKLPHFLIAPVFNFFEELEERITQTGIAPGLLHQLVASILDEHDMHKHELDPMEKLAQSGMPVRIFHDKQDRFALYHFSEMANRYPHVELHTASDLGHMRIIRSEQMHTLLLDFLERIDSLAVAKEEPTSP